ncbi:MAG: GatB/YqeY domain-containing protein [Vicinamibacterales bacterium]
MKRLENLDKAIGEAMKGRERVRLDALRMLKTALLNREIEAGRRLDEPEALKVVASLVKQRRDSIEQFIRGGRQELADKEAAEIAVLEEYLPPPADAAEVDQVIEEAIVETGAASAADLGRVMKLVMPRLAGKGVEGKEINARVRARLAR